MTEVRDMTNEELAENLKQVVWKGGWDSTVKEIERRLKKLSKLEAENELLRSVEQ